MASSVGWPGGHCDAAQEMMRDGGAAVTAQSSSSSSPPRHHVTWQSLTRKHQLVQLVHAVQVVQLVPVSRSDLSTYLDPALCPAPHSCWPSQRNSSLHSRHSFQSLPRLGLRRDECSQPTPYLAAVRGRALAAARWGGCHCQNNQMDTRHRATSNCSSPHRYCRLSCNSAKMSR